MEEGSDMGVGVSQIRIEHLETAFATKME